jgi:metallophosphoesterase (TIGR00282 family)
MGSWQMNILCIGDIVGKPGRDALTGLLGDIKKEFNIECVIANAENAAGGAGLTSRLAKQFLLLGCDVLTLGDHTWDQKELESYLESSDDVIRPANFPDGTPGKGWCVKTLPSGKKVGVINLLGRVFMRFSVNCPFREADRLIKLVKEQTPIVIIDMHAETTSEKVAMGHYVDGRASAVFGTHTHIPTADEQVLSNGTAYITDLGMTGPYDSVIGQEKEDIIKRFLAVRPTKFHTAQNDARLSAVVISVDEKTGLARKIVRLQRLLPVEK